MSTKAFERYMERIGAPIRRVIELTYVIDVTSPAELSDDSVTDDVLETLIIDPDIGIVTGRGNKITAVVTHINLRFKETR